MLAAKPHVSPPHRWSPHLQNSIINILSVCMYVCVCVCICMYVCISQHCTHVHMSTICSASLDFTVSQHKKPRDTHTHTYIYIYTQIVYLRTWTGARNPSWLRGQIARENPGKILWCAWRQPMSLRVPFAAILGRPLLCWPWWCRFSPPRNCPPVCVYVCMHVCMYVCVNGASSSPLMLQTPQPWCLPPYE
jgi:hypothetical protein